MFKVVQAFVDFKVDPPTVGEAGQVIFIDEFLRDVGKFDSDIFWAVEGRGKIEVFYVEAGEACIWCGDDTVD